MAWKSSKKLPSPWELLPQSNSFFHLWATESHFCFVPSVKKSHATITGNQLSWLRLTEKMKLTISKSNQSSKFFFFSSSPHQNITKCEHGLYSALSGYFVTSLTDSCGARKEHISISGYLLFHFADGCQLTTESRNNVSNCMVDYCKEPSVWDSFVLCVGFFGFFSKMEALRKETD